ncbi:MAG: hypothetical protein ACK4WH_09130 [Phycisphaerales bacterium]
MNFPARDPQFWVTTAVFVAAAWWLVRGVWPRRGGSKGRRPGRRVALTIEGRAAKKGR